MKDQLIVSNQPKECFDKFPVLSITWSKHEEEVYIHHACLLMRMVENCLFPPELAKIDIVARERYFEKGIVSKFYDNKISKYLPVESEENYLKVPLNAWEILENLEANSWTNSKKNNRINLKLYPYSLSCLIAGKNPDIFYFSAEDGNTPFLLSEPYFESIEDGQCITTFIQMGDENN